MHYWLLKSEPDCFSIDHLAKKPKQTDQWDGVRNYQARNMLRDEMKVGDQAFFYHSSCPQPGIVGQVKIVKAGFPDPTQFNPEAQHYDPKSTEEKPIWYTIDVQLIKKFKHIVTLDEIKKNPLLETMQLVKRGNRLSIMPVSMPEWQTILSMTG
jgi:predicted RNA-binding protein with PUA-like domain